MSKRDSRGWRVSAGIAGLAVLMGAGGCLPGFEGEEDEPEIVPQYNFADIHAAGFAPPQGSCMGSTGEMKLRVVLEDDRAYPIQLGVELGDDQTVVGDDTIFVEMRNAALVEPEVTGDCSDDSCSDGFSCQVGPGEEGNWGIGEGEACLREDEIGSASESLSFISDVANDQVFGVLVENAGSLSGWNPPGTDGAWDADGDGVADVPSHTGGLVESIATDSKHERYTAVMQMAARANPVVEAAQETGRKTFFGLWSFNSNSATPQSHVEGVSTTAWTKDLGTFENAANDYANNSQSEPSRANIYEAVRAVLSSQYDTAVMAELGVSAPESVDKVLAVFVDGIDDLRENDDATIDEVIELANQNNVRLFIVHLDARLESPERRREDSEYFLGQTPCSDDSACKNYERCRLPRGYSAQAGDPIDSIPAEYQGNTYCLPEYGEDGRIGPLHDYARLACSTGGGYIYTRAARALRWRASARGQAAGARALDEDIYRERLESRYG